jgi:hypothetical protein
MLTNRRATLAADNPTERFRKGRGSVWPSTVRHARLVKEVQP